MKETTENREKNVRDLLLAMVEECNGDWDKIFNYISTKKQLSQQTYERVANKGYNFIGLTDSQYPEKLKQSYKPPFGLFYEGWFNTLEESDNIIAILNENLASKYACDSIEAICKDLREKCTFAIAFGSKKNNDLIRSLLSVGSRIIAVLDVGIGIENVEDKELYEKLKNEQLILSSYPSGLKNKTKTSSVDCSKLQAQLSKGVIVGGVTKNSTQVTALAFALEQNTDIYCIPFPIGSNYINNRLIQDGAILLDDSETIFVNLKKRKDNKK